MTTAKYYADDPEAVKESQHRYYKVKGRRYTHNDRQPWSKRDDELVLNPGKLKDLEVAERLGRTVRAIEVRRHALGAKERR